MHRMLSRRALLLCSFAGLAMAQKYDGPRPEKTDLPYLLQAGRLLATESGEAQMSEKKNETVYTVAGDSSKVRTPLAEPIFLFAPKTLQPEKLGLYRFEVRGGQREVVIPKKGGGPRPFRFVVTRLEEGLFRLDVAETLERGEYGFSPDGANAVFCFQVF
jgi:hypothetical protein